MYSYDISYDKVGEIKKALAYNKLKIFQFAFNNFQFRNIPT